MNHLATHGRWAFAEFCDVYEIEADFATKMEAQFEIMIDVASQIEENLNSTPKN